MKLIVIKCFRGTFLWVCGIGSEPSSWSLAVIFLPWNLMWSRILTS